MRSSSDKAAHSEAELLKASETLQAWLCKDKCHLRAVFHVLNGGGCFYSASMAEKTARAWLKGGGGSDKKLFDAVVARHHNEDRGASASAGASSQDNPAADMFK